MDLGQRLKQARLEAGMSQRQLCGTVITRNMLSQIENGSAKPSMDTLRYLAAQLGKPMGYFLEEQAVTSPNQRVMERARAAFSREPASALKILEEYRGEDSVFDAEYHLLCALCGMALAKQATEQGRNAYALTLLEEVAVHGQRSPYYTPELERGRLLLCFAARPELASRLVSQLPDPTPEILLRAMAETDPVKRGLLLDSAPRQESQWHLQRAEVYLSQKNYAKAIDHLERAPKTRQVYEKLEFCCRELEDYKGAYFYAVKAREWAVPADDAL